MENITNFIFIIILLICTFTIIFKLNKNEIKINNKTTDMFMYELDRMILYHTVYNIDVMFGASFSNNKGITTDIDNDELMDTVVSIEKEIISNMGDNMKTYLYTVFGEEWIYKYINIQTLSLALNYTKISINSLTRKIFNQ